jgi:Amt family ammonium transporter
VTTGLLAGIVYVLASKLIIRLRIDDAVDAIPVHLFGGMLGLIMSGLISSPTLIERAYPNSGSEHAGWLHMWSEGSGDFHLIGAQLVAIIFIFSWSFTMMGLFFGAMNYLGWYRVDALEELAGLDISRHKGQAYFIENATDEHVEMLNQSRRPLTKEKTETGVDVPAEEAAAEESKDV